jgi:hypothetical protein
MLVVAMPPSGCRCGKQQSDNCAFQTTIEFIRLKLLSVATQWMFVIADKINHSHPLTFADSFAAIPAA